MKKAFVNYKSEGITTELCIKVCIDYDVTVTKEKSHPRTSSDILNSTQMVAKKALENNIEPSTDENISE